MSDNLKYSSQFYFIEVNSRENISDKYLSELFFRFVSKKSKIG